MWLEKFLDILEIDELEAVIGHSYGGKLAGYAWLISPNKLPKLKQGLFLIGPSGIPNKLSIPLKIIRQFLAFIPYQLKRGLFAPLRKKLYQTIEADADYLNLTPFQEKILRLILNEDLRKKQ